MSMAARYAETLADYRETARVVRCRYLRRNDEQCTAEAVAAEADVLLCMKHLGRALAVVNAQTAALRKTSRATR